MPFIGSSFFVIGLPVFFISQEQIFEASLVLVAWGGGQLLSPLILLINSLRNFSYNIKVARYSLILIFLTGVTVGFLTLLNLNIYIYLIFVFIAGCGWSIFQITKRNLVALWGETWVRQAGALGRVGAAIGVIIHPLIILNIENGILLSAALTVSVLFSPAFIKNVMLLPLVDEIKIKNFKQSIIPLFDNLIIVVSSYGFIAFYTVLISITSSVEWVVFFMPAYMLGALVSPFIASKVNQFWKTNYSGLIILVMVANLTWLGLLVHPITIPILGFISGILFFVVEGSLDWSAAEKTTTSELVLGRALGSTIMTILMAWLIFVFREEPLELLLTYLIFGLVVSSAYTVFRRIKLPTLKL